MSLSTFELASQIREILTPAIVSDEDCRLQLVPNFCGTSVYEVNTCWGRLWRVLWFLVGLFDWGGNCRAEALHKAMGKTCEAWKKKQSSILEHIRIFHQYLQQAVQAPQFLSATDVQAMGKAQKKLVKWVQYISSAFEEEGVGTLAHKIQKLNRVLQTVTESEVDIVDTTMEIMNRAYAAYSALNLQARMGIFYPLAAFEKLSSQKPLSQEEQQEMVKFVGRLQVVCSSPKAYKRVTIRELGTALKVILEQLNATEEGLQSLVWALYQSLESLGCHVFRTQDPEHYREVQRYAEVGNQTVTVNGEEVLLGVELGPMRTNDTDQHFVFECGENVAVFSTCNQMTLRLEHLERGKTQLQLPELIEISDTYAIYEKLLDSPAHCDWNSTEDWIQMRLGAVTDFIAEMIEKKFTPEQLSAEMLAFDSKNRLKFIKPVPIGEFDWVAVCEFMRRCFAGNDLVFEIVASRSGFNDTTESQYYKRAVPHVLVGRNEALVQLRETIGATTIFNKEGLLSQIASIQAEVQALKTSVLDRITQKYNLVHVSQQEVEHLIARKVAAELQSKCLIGCHKGVKAAEFAERLAEEIAKAEVLPMRSTYVDHLKPDMVNWYKNRPPPSPGAKTTIKDFQDYCAMKGIHPAGQIAKLFNELTSPPPARQSKT